ncbi:unnamed protein product [Caenorhabditis nigoni]
MDAPEFRSVATRFRLELTDYSICLFQLHHPLQPIAEAQEAPQLDPSDDEVDEAIQELGPGSWPRPDATEEQMKEAGQAKREVAAHKKRALELKRQREERKLEKKRLMEQEEQLKGEKEEEEEEEQKFAAMMQRRRNELQEKQFLFRRFLMEDLRQPSSQGCLG